MPICLCIVLLVINVSRCSILRTIDFFSLSLRDHSIGLGPILHPIDPSLFPFQPVGLALVQLATGDSLVNALFLVGLPLVDARCFGLGIGCPGHQ